MNSIMTVRFYSLMIMNTGSRKTQEISRLLKVFKKNEKNIKKSVDKLKYWDYNAQHKDKGAFGNPEAPILFLLPSFYQRMAGQGRLSI